jgi:hypothetical protein
MKYKFLVNPNTYIYIQAQYSRPFTMIPITAFKISHAYSPFKYAVGIVEKLEEMRNRVKRKTWE